jgi:hypothetical protein
MKSCSVSKMTLPQMLGSSVVLFALAASYATYARAEDRFSGMLGVERQKVEKPNDGEAKRRPEKRVEQPRAEAPRAQRGERNVERRVERRDDRIAERQHERRIERVERRPEHRVYRQPVWRGDIRYFDRDDAHRWRGGAWRQTRHDGRFGWWWVVGGGSWYFYSQPVYPYPDPYIPSVVVTQSEPVDSTPDIVVAPAAASQSWYYCESTQGYYPYTALCPEGWKSVPATPPANPSPAQ